MSLWCSRKGLAQDRAYVPIMLLVLDDMAEAESYRGNQRLNELVETLERLVLGHLAAGRDSSIEYIRLEGKLNSKAFAKIAQDKLSVYVPHVELVLN